MRGPRERTPVLFGRSGDRLYAGSKTSQTTGDKGASMDPAKPSCLRVGGPMGDSTNHAAQTIRRSVGVRGRRDGDGPPTMRKSLMEVNPTKWSGRIPG